MRLAATDLGLSSQRSGHLPPSSARLGAWHDALATAKVPTAPVTAPTTSANADSVAVSPEGQAKSLSEPDQQQKQVLEILDRMFGITQVQSMDLKIATSHSAGASHSVSTSSDGDTSTYAESFRAYDQTSLAAKGTITLDDGRKFSLDLQYQRTVAFASDLSIQGGNPPVDGSASPANGSLPPWAGGAQDGNVPSWLANYQTTGVTADPAATAPKDSGRSASLLKQISEFLRQLNQAGNANTAVDLVA